MTIEQINNASLRLSIGIWIARGQLERNNAHFLLNVFGLYNYVPRESQTLNHELALKVIDIYRSKNKVFLDMPSGYIFKAQQTCNVISELFDDWQQAEILIALETESKKFLA